MRRHVKENCYHHSQSSLDSKQTDFSVHHMTSLARHFSVLTHTLELHIKSHVNILGSQKKFSKCSLEFQVHHIQTFQAQKKNF